MSIKVYYTCSNWTVKPYNCFFCARFSLQTLLRSLLNSLMTASECDNKKDRYADLRKCKHECYDRVAQKQECLLQTFMYNKTKMMKVTKVHYHQQPKAQNTSLFLNHLLILLTLTISLLIKLQHIILLRINLLVNYSQIKISWH